jgi:hypothetical protein
VSCPAKPALIVPEPCQTTRVRSLISGKSNEAATDIIDDYRLVCEDVVILCRHVAGQWDGRGEAGSCCGTHGSGTSLSSTMSRLWPLHVWALVVLLVTLIAYAVRGLA